MKNQNDILTQYLENRNTVIKHTPKKNGKYRDGTQRWTLGKINGKSEDDPIFPRNFQLKPTDALWSGKDWVRIVFFSTSEAQDLQFSPFLTLFSGMNGTNASDMIFDFLGETFDVIRKSKYLFFFLDGIRVFTCERLTEKEKEMRGLEGNREAFVFDFFGKFFGLERMGVFKSEDFLEKVNDYFSGNGKPYRVDIAIDLPFGLEKILKNADLGSPKKTFYGKDAYIETIYFGSKDDKEAFIRIYDKKIKAEKDGEEIFYPYIFGKDERVWRIEVQLCAKILKGLSSADVLNQDIIMGLFRSYCQSNKKYLDFDFLEYKKIPRIRDVSNAAKEEYFVSRIYRMWKSAKENKLSTKRIKKMLDNRYFNETLEKIS